MCTNFQTHKIAINMTACLWQLYKVFRSCPYLECLQGFLSIPVIRITLFTILLTVQHCKVCVYSFFCCNCLSWFSMILIPFGSALKALSNVIGIIKMDNIDAYKSVNIALRLQIRKILEALSPILLVAKENIYASCENEFCCETHDFSNLDKADMKSFSDFLQESHVKVKNPPEEYS